MKPHLLALLCCPGCGGDLSLRQAFEKGGEIERGVLICVSCDRKYPIEKWVPRFVEDNGDTNNFGLQWNHFRQTQLDSHTGVPISRNRFFRQTGWAPDQLVGKIVLDVGCGAGRFAEVALSCGAQVVAVDSSSAVDACWANLSPHPRLHVMQADVYAFPFRPEQFDFVYCLGVLQHTPQVHEALLALVTQLAQGGRLAVDVYLRSLRSGCHPKYWLRPLTTRLAPDRLFSLVERAAPGLLQVSRVVRRIPGLGPYLSRLVPVANYEGVYPLSRSQLTEWAVLDTYDWLSPRWDQPQRPETLRAWLVEAGLEEIEVFVAHHLTGRALKPVQSAN